jgi:hypothetical protein
MARLARSQRSRQRRGLWSIAANTRNGGPIEVANCGLSKKFRVRDNIEFSR